MCESNAYFIANGEEQLVLESVSFLRPEGNSILLRSLFGEEVTVKGKIRELDLVGHKILLESL